MFFDKAIAEQSHADHVSTDNLSIPFDWLFGTTLTVSALFFSVVWWVRGIKSQVDNNSRGLEAILSKCVSEQSKMDNFHNKLQEDLRRKFQDDIDRSSSTICHGFQLFSVEMKLELKRLQEKIDERNAAIADLSDRQDRHGKRLESLGSEFAHVVSQLQSQNLDIHYRERD